MGEAMTKSQAIAAVVEAAREMVRVRQSNNDPDIANTKYVRAIIERHIQKLADSIAALDAAPDAPQDAEVREGLIRVLHGLSFRPIDITKEAQQADAILAYLHSQGFRRVREGE